MLAATIAHAQRVERVAPDALLHAFASTALDTLGVTRDVWPGYVVPSQFMACSAIGTTVVVGDSATLAYFGTGSAETAHRRIRLLPTPPAQLAGVCFDLAFKVGQVQLVAVPVIGVLYSIRDSLTSNVVQLYHEGFHAFQGRTFAATRASQYAPWQEVRLPLEVVRSPAFDSLARVERLLLIESLRSEQLDSVRILLATYLHVRDMRMRLLSPKFALAEAHNERKEGSAQWVGYTAALLRMRGSRVEVPQIIALDLQHTPSFGEGRSDDYFGNGYRQWHIYATGAAIGVLLEKLGIEWREELQAGASFEELLRRFVRDLP